MSIVGAQSVSMSDLMKMGVPALNAMAQGQQNSIAPPYLILAALKALTDQQKGMGAAAPQGTVKDQILAQTRPTVQTGIGAMAPPGAMVPQQPQPQGFSGGGTVESLMRGVYGTETPEETEARGVSARQKFFDWLKGKGTVYYGQKDTAYEQAPSLPATQATPSTSNLDTNYGNESRRVVPPSVPTPEVPVGGSARVSASSSTRGGGGAGIGSAGKNPLSKYSSEMGPVPSAASFPLDIPQNQQLQAAYEKYSTPDEARLAEMAQEKKMAGLGALAKGIMKGRGFGAAFGPAAADSVAAESAEAQKIREYKDKRDAVAAELGIKVGENARADFLTKTEYGDKQAAREWDRAEKKLDRVNAVAGLENRDIFEQQKIDVDRARVAMMGEANRISAEIRRDGLNASNQARIERLYQTAKEVAIKDAEAVYGKTDPMMGPLNPEREKAKMRHMEAVFNQEYARLNAALGREGGTAPATAGRKPLGIMGQ